MNTLSSGSHVASIDHTIFDRGAEPSARVFAYLLASLTVLIYILLITNCSLNLFGADQFGLTFNSMLAHLLHGRWDVDPAAIGYEAFVREGRSYAYFGPFPALLRLPLLLIPGWRTLHVERLSCLIAMLLGAAAQWGAIAAVLSRASTAVRQALTPSLMLGCALSGPPILLGGKGALIYHESILWAWAFAMLFVTLALRSMLRSARPSASTLTLMALCAGLCLLTRSTTGAGLFLVMALLLIRELANGRWQDLPYRLTNFGFYGPSLIMSGFVAVAGIVNYGRWGTPLRFADLRAQIFLIAVHPDRLIRLQHYGLFNVQRIWIGFLYYFAPIWTSWADTALPLDNQISRLFDALELPASSVILTDPMWCMLAGCGIVSVVRARAFRGSALLLIGLSLAPALMLTAWYMAFRYRSEFTPLLLVLSCIGLAEWVSRLDDIRLKRRRLLLLCFCGMQVLSANAFDLLYRTAPFGPSPNYAGISLSNNQ